MKSCPCIFLVLALFGLVACSTGCERRGRVVVTGNQASKKPQAKKEVRSSEHHKKAKSSKNSKRPEKREQSKAVPAAEEVTAQDCEALDTSRLLDPDTSPANKTAERLLEIFGAMADAATLDDRRDKTSTRRNSRRSE